MHDFFKNFGERVRNRRLELHDTQAGLASRLGKCNRTIIQLENGKGNTKFETVALVAQDLNISIDASVFPDASPNGVPKCVIDFFGGMSEKDAQKYIDLCKQANRLK